MLIDRMHEDDVSVFHVRKNNIYRIVGVLGLPIQCIDTPEDSRLSETRKSRLHTSCRCPVRRTDKVYGLS